VERVGRGEKVKARGGVDKGVRNKEGVYGRKVGGWGVRENVG